ncbi:MAG: hypothetical protein VX444_10655 [Pseudomonadota bacterium]|nr:hypothetical protein [Pseudomonadota bacterium]
MSHIPTFLAQMKPPFHLRIRRNTRGNLYSSSVPETRRLSQLAIYPKTTGPMTPPFGGLFQPTTQRESREAFNKIYTFPSFPKSVVP